MKAPIRGLAAAAVATLGLSLAAAPVVAKEASPTQPHTATAAAATASGAPAVLPSLRQWTGRPGSFELTPHSRIVVNSTALWSTATTFRDDLARETGHRLQVLNDRARAGDVVLSVDHDTSLGDDPQRVAGGDQPHRAGRGEDGHGPQGPVEGHGGQPTHRATLWTRTRTCSSIEP